jgi:16S rRNA (guanine966-N2)-methyltransferase
MRIISGKLKGRKFEPPQNLSARPTTDFAKTGLFNIISARKNINECTVLDLFCGTGSISFEFISRGAINVHSVEKDTACTSFMSKASSQYELHNLKVIRTEVFSFLNICYEKYDIIFADPPYLLKDLELIPEIIFSKNLLKENGLLIVEHSNRRPLSHLKGFESCRKYGNVSFSFFTFDKTDK